MKPSVCPRYSTAYAESDYTDRDTDREEGEREPEQESEEEEEEDKSCATVLTLRQEDSQEEELEEEDEEEDDGRLQLVTEVPSGELALLLAQSDILHTGDGCLKAEGFRLLLDNRAEVRTGLCEPLRKLFILMRIIIITVKTPEM